MYKAQKQYLYNKGKTKHLTYKAHTYIIVGKKGGERMSEAKTSEAQRKAIYKYDEKWERVNCRFKIGTKDSIKKAGYTSIQDFIKLAVAEKLEREKNILK